MCSAVAHGLDKSLKILELEDLSPQYSRALYTVYLIDIVCNDVSTNDWP